MITDTSGFTKVIILGAGAIGSYYSSMLSRKTDVLTSLIRFMEGKEWS
jgi:ketopantoate reductase